MAEAVKLRSRARASCAVALTALGPLSAGAQVVREEGAKPIAGVLQSAAAPGVAFTEWTFRSRGGEVLFATLDADIYRVAGSHDLTESMPGSLAEDEDDHGGGGLFRLKVLGPTGAVLCAASRPAPPPGWQRDPRLACALPGTSSPVTYRLRVELAPFEGELIRAQYPFLLNVSLRGIATSGTSLQEAFARSSAGGF